MPHLDARRVAGTVLTGAALLLPAAALHAQQANPVGRCASPDSVAVLGNNRVAAATIRSTSGLMPGAALNYRAIQRAVRDLYASGQFESDIRISCAPTAAGERAVLIIAVRERPVLQSVRVEGTDRVSDKSVRDLIDLVPGRPVDPALVARAVHGVDSLYESEGYYLARVRPETTVVGDSARLVFRIEEGNRLAISGVRVHGNSRLGAADIVAAMQTKPEGFWWWRRGEFERDRLDADLGERIPALYGQRGYIDFRVVNDTLIVDRQQGKALIDLTVAEGPRYRIGSFEATGNRRFSSEEIQQFYPFKGETPALTTRVKDALRRVERTPAGIFDRAAWEEATNRLRTAYSNEGYIYANIRPVVERTVGPDSQPRVDLRWEIEERSPAIVNRVEVQGNDYTTEQCIRDQIILLPGDVFSQERLIRSWQSVSNMGFFETPIPPPDTRTANDQGDIDIIFKVKEKRTGNINFGASMGQGYGVGGFIGLDQPNLFGECKRGSLQWQFGRYINDFNLSYTDPFIRQTRVSGTVAAYRTQTRYNIADLGRSLRTGGSLQLGFPVPGSPFSRLFVSYGAEKVSFGTGGLLGEERNEFGNGSVRSTLGFTASHDTRIDMPFPTAGSMQSASAQFNGGLLGGTASFRRFTAETHSYVPLGHIGAAGLGSQPMTFVAGLTARAGALFGNPGAFFYSQQFALGGVQFGEMLRGYDEFSVTPAGFVTTTSTYQAQRSSFGNAFFTTTAELGLRLNQALYTNVFFDAGNIWRRPREFDPTRLYRGAGVGVSVITPLGPLGLDYAYGFDRVDAAGRPSPKWQLHFRLGQLF